MGCRVMILEDDPSLRSIYTVQLNSMGHTITPVGSAEEALKVFKPGDFDCLLVDYRLPKMTGVEFVKRVRAKDDRVGVVISTAANRDEVDHLVEGLGVWAVISKPSPVSYIEEKIHEACELSHLSPEKEAAFVAGFDEESKQMNVLSKDLLNETGIWPPDQLHKV